MHIPLMDLCNAHLPHKVGTRHFRVTIKITNTHTHTCSHTHTLTHAHTLTHTHTHTCTEVGWGELDQNLIFFKERLLDVKAHGDGEGVGWGAL